MGNTIRVNGQLYQEVVPDRIEIDGVIYEAVDDMNELFGKRSRATKMAVKRNPGEHIMNPSKDLRRMGYDVKPNSDPLGVTYVSPIDNEKYSVYQAYFKHNTWPTLVVTTVAGNYQIDFNEENKKVKRTSITNVADEFARVSSPVEARKLATQYGGFRIRR